MFQILIRRGRRRACSIAVAVLAITGSTSCDTILGSRDSVTPVWRSPLGADDRNTETTPATDGERLYVIGGQVFALDVQTGARLWTYRPAGETFRPRNVVVRNGRVREPQQDAGLPRPAAGGILPRRPTSRGPRLVQAEQLLEPNCQPGTPAHRTHR